MSQSFPRLTCPHCHSVLISLSEHKVQFWECSDCHGRAAQYSQLKASLLRPYQLNTSDQIHFSASAKSCPACAKSTMPVLLVFRERSITLQVCAPCDLAFLEAHHLATLLK